MPSTQSKKHQQWKEMKLFLDEQVEIYNRPSFVELDPVSIPHRFSKKEDIEISAFLTSTIAWGNRKSILVNATRIIAMMDDDPYAFVLNHTASDLLPLKSFVHRTFNGEDLITFVKLLRILYLEKGGLEAVFSKGFKQFNDAGEAIHFFRTHFFEASHLQRTEKHVSNPMTGAASKRINMMLRWLVRNDGRGVDLGIWTKINSAHLSIPLDIHTGTISRELNLLQRKQDDWKSVMELDKVLRTFDAIDPVKYDYALFGIGVNAKSKALL